MEKSISEVAMLQQAIEPLIQKQRQSEKKRKKKRED